MAAAAGVRFSREGILNTAAVAQLVERVLGKDEVLGSNPSGSSGIRRPGPDERLTGTSVVSSAAERSGLSLAGWQ